MNSLEIANILNSNSLTAKCFKGVYSANNIPYFNEVPHGIVVNTDKLGEPGTHWVAIYVKDKNSVEYFDSFAQPPNKFIENYLKKFQYLKINKTKIQSIFDTSCGSHVIYFLFHRCIGRPFDSIVKILNDPFSDSFVKLFVYKLINKMN
jgi:hypothetical protein